MAYVKNSEKKPLGEEGFWSDTTWLSPCCGSANLVSIRGLWDSGP